MKIEEKKRINEHRDRKGKGKKKKIPQRVQGLVVEALKRGKVSEREREKEEKNPQRVVTVKLPIVSKAYVKRMR